MADPSRAPVLSISTVVPRQTLTIDGQPYELRTADELPWLIFRGYADTFQRAGALLQQGTRTDAEEQALEQLLPPLIEALVIAPRDVLAKLSHEHRFQILTVFSLLLSQTPATTTAAPRRPGSDAIATTRPGRKSPHASRGSTAARRGTGSRSVRSVS